jgi:AAA15 family ATPase/GTPase
VQHSIGGNKLKIIKYKVSDGSENCLDFEQISLSQFNLIVGYSGSGKSRLLNTIFNCACLVTQKKFSLGEWDLTFEHLGQIYRWIIKTGVNEKKEPKILEEKVITFDENENEESTIERRQTELIYKGKELPKMAADESAVSLLKEEDSIKPLFLGLQSIMRRDFSGKDLDDATSIQIIGPRFLTNIKKDTSLKTLFAYNIGLSGKLYILSKHFKGIYDRIIEEFINIFPFVSSVDIKKPEDWGIELPGFAPVIAMKEKGVSIWIPLYEMASGMKKVLLILTDILAMPDEGVIYLIDEYENSLGTNVINSFPSILFECDAKIQFIITSHHPYIIGNIPVKNWIILHRKGTVVSARQGPDLEMRFGKSRQEAFIQLINDSFYLQGNE